MRRIAIALTIIGTMLVGTGSAHAASLGSFGGMIFYTADPGERNNLVITPGTSFGGTVPIYVFRDNGIPIRVTGGPCEVINGVGQCRQAKHVPRLAIACSHPA